MKKRQINSAGTDVCQRKRSQESILRYSCTRKIVEEAINSLNQSEHVSCVQEIVVGTDEDIRKFAAQKNNWFKERVMYSIIRKRILAILYNPTYGSRIKRFKIMKLGKLSTDKIFIKAYLQAKQDLFQLIPHD